MSVRIMYFTTDLLLQVSTQLPSSRSLNTHTHTHTHTHIYIYYY